MWTKQYIFHPTKDEFFKTKHPIASAFMILPLGNYYLYCLIHNLNSCWMFVGALGCLLLGTGFCYGFAVIRKIYEKVYVPVLCLILMSAE